MSRFPRQGDPTLGKFIRYMEEVATNTRYNYIERLKRQKSKETLIPDPIERVAEPVLKTASVLEDITDNRALYAALLDLSPMEKKVLLLAVVEDRPMTEVRELLQISSARAYKLRQTALNKLRALLKEGFQYD